MRIATLEGELSALREAKESETRRGGRRLEGGTLPTVPSVRIKLDEYKRRLAAAEERVAELERALTSSREELERERDAREAEREAEKHARASAMVVLDSMVTVTVHNRARPPDERGEPAGVLCSLCHLIGSKVEMRLIDNVAHCPRCLFAQLLG